MKTPRPYQSEAAEALFNDLKPGVHPIAAIPTGAGKTLVMCDFIDRYLTSDPTCKILVLSHVKEILEQNYEALEDHFEGWNIGLYSAGLGSRTVNKITVAGIQSVHRKPELFEDVSVVIIDECHLVNARSAGMYRNFLAELDANYVGLTATHFRTGHGYIHKGDDALFNKLSYNMCHVEGINHLIEKGWLCKLIAKGTSEKLDTSGLKTRMNDYVSKEMSKRFDRDSITTRAVDEVVAIGGKYRKWLVFAIDIKHAENIARKFNRKGVPTSCVHSKMEGDREVEIAKFKSGQYRCMVNVDILTTGFDAPDIDLIAMLRPTQSPILHVQSLGRGMRISDGKDHCLVLDFAGNVARLGPINDVEIRQINKTGDGKGGARMKECPECQGLLHNAAKECEYCGYKYPVREKITEVAYEGDIIRTKKPIMELKAAWMPVTSVKYHYNGSRQPGKLPTMKVQYLVGYKSFAEYVCLDHPRGSYPRHKAENWVSFRLKNPRVRPTNVRDLCYQASKDMLKTPKRVKVALGGKFPTIEDVEF